MSLRMICNRCARQLARQTSSATFAHHTSIARRTFISSSIRRNTATISTDSPDLGVGRPHGNPAATSTSAAQPFSAGDADPLLQATRSPVRQPSSCPEGTVLKGINFMKNQQDPVAMADDQYPEWLWHTLDRPEAESGAVSDQGDLFSKSKKQRRLAAKALRKQQTLDPALLQPKIPMQEQTTDLYSGDGTIEGAVQAGEKRQELTKAMREARRAKIKETNFLKTMA